MDNEIVKTIMIRGTQNDYLDMLNLLGKWDISKEPCDEIVQLCRRSSWGSTRNQTLAHDAYTRILKSNNNGETWVDIGNMLKNFKIDIMISMYSQFDVLQKNKIRWR